MLVLLGDQLIRNAGIAVFELVKNGYDADADEVNIEMLNVDDMEKGRIIVSDNGVGMNWEIITEVWLEPGTDYRALQKKGGEKTKKFNRTPMGEKGIGRFAAHKLGRNISLVTRCKDSPEVVVDIDWKEFLGAKYLSDTPVTVIERKPEIFTGDDTGTRIEISGLYQEWTRGMVRDLHRSATSISSPFRQPGSFIANFIVKPKRDWLKGLLDLKEVMELAPFEAVCLVETSGMTLDYTFEPPPGMERVKKREVRDKKFSFGSIVDMFSLETRKRIGDLLFDLRIFDLDPQVLQLLVSDKKGLRDFLHLNGGIRVYRDGLRVFDYGEPGNDWLNLGTKRVNVPTRRVSNNLLLGAVQLDSVSSSGLIEKTNREGFVENDEFKMFVDLVTFALTQIVTERNRDKERIRKAYASKKLREPVLNELEELRLALKKKKRLDKELGGYIDQIEKQFLDVRDRLLTAAGPGLTMSVVIHEVEKGISGLVDAVRREVPMDQLSTLAGHLAELVDGLTYLTRRSGRKHEKASILIKQAFFNTGYRVRAHDVKTFNGTESGDEEFSVKCTRRMIIASLMNLIDNSIYWLVNKGHKNKRIYIGTTGDLQGGPAIVVADNGPGFSDPTDYLVQPFITRRPDGMGLGLHVADEVMKANGGKLLFPEPGSVNLPKGYTGAVVALQFQEAEK